MLFRRRKFASLFSMALSALLATSPARAQDQNDDEAPKPIPVELQTAVTRTEFLGRQLYLHDRAAWLATDAMLADKRMRKLKTSIGGWVTEPSALGIRVMFISQDASPRRLYEIDVDEAEHLSDATVESPTPLTAEHLAQLRARKLADSQPYMTCAKQYNVVVLPSSSGIRVYLMPGFSKQSVYPLGGYHLFEIDGTGEKILSSRKFSNGCIEHSDSPKGLPKGATPSFGMFTHLIDPQPTEVHVFVSLYAKVPMMVMTVDNKVMWSVKNGKVTLIDTMD
jgi:hypothetical protein